MRVGPQTPPPGPCTAHDRTGRGGVAQGCCIHEAAAAGRPAQSTSKKESARRVCGLLAACAALLRLAGPCKPAQVKLRLLVRIRTHTHAIKTVASMHAWTAQSTGAHTTAPSQPRARQNTQTPQVQLPEGRYYGQGGVRERASGVVHLLQDQAQPARQRTLRAVPGVFCSRCGGCAGGAAWGGVLGA